MRISRNFWDTMKTLFLQINRNIKPNRCSEVHDSENLLQLYWFSNEMQWNPLSSLLYSIDGFVPSQINTIKQINVLRSIFWKCSATLWIFKWNTIKSNHSSSLLYSIDGVTPSMACRSFTVYNNYLLNYAINCILIPRKIQIPLLIGYILKL